MARVSDIDHRLASLKGEVDDNARQVYEIRHSDVLNHNHTVDGAAHDLVAMSSSITSLANAAQDEFSSLQHEQGAGRIAMTALAKRLETAEKKNSQLEMDVLTIRASFAALDARTATTAISAHTHAPPPPFPSQAFTFRTASQAVAPDMSKKRSAPDTPVIPPPAAKRPPHSIISFWVVMSPVTTTGGANMTPFGLIKRYVKYGMPTFNMGTFLLNSLKGRRQRSPLDGNTSVMRYCSWIAGELRLLVDPLRVSWFLGHRLPKLLLLHRP